MPFSRKLIKGDPDTGLQTIVESALKMEAIVTDVLNFAKPVQVETKEEDLREVVKQTAAGCRARAEGAGISIASQLLAEPVRMPVDGLRLQRALTNWVVNAMEASKHGQEVRIELPR
jgi:signal transduction histidine kinase